MKLNKITAQKIFIACGIVSLLTLGACGEDEKGKPKNKIVDTSATADGTDSGTGGTTGSNTGTSTSGTGTGGTGTTGACSGVEQCSPVGASAAGCMPPTGPAAGTPVCDASTPCEGNLMCVNRQGASSGSCIVPCSINNTCDGSLLCAPTDNGAYICIDTSGGSVAAPTGAVSCDASTPCVDTNTTCTTLTAGAQTGNCLSLCNQ